MTPDQQAALALIVIFCAPFALDFIITFLGHSPRHFGRIRK
jgi:hypothetical protein